MSKQDKPRVWKIYGAICAQRGSAAFDDWKSPKHTLVIEKSAYDELKAKHEELISYIPKVPTHPYEKRLLEEISELKAENEKLRKALEEIGQYDSHIPAFHSVFEIARNALDKVSK